MHTVGGPIFTSPSTVLEAMRRVNTDVETVHAEIEVNATAGRVPSTFAASWLLFRGEWATFYAANQSEMAMLVTGTGTVMRQTQDYSARVVQWRTQLAALPGIKLIAPAPLVLKDPNAMPPVGGVGEISDLTKLVNAVALVGGVLLVGYVAVVYVPKFLPASKS